MHFFISRLASWLRTRRFSEVTFRPSGATSHWKNAVNLDIPTFSRTCAFFLLILFLLWSSHFLSSPLWLLPPLFHLSILSEVWLLNFVRVSIFLSIFLSFYLWSKWYLFIYLYIYNIYISYLWLYVSVCYLWPCWLCAHTQCMHLLRPPWLGRLQGVMVGGQDDQGRNLAIPRGI